MYFCLQGIRYVSHVLHRLSQAHFAHAAPLCRLQVGMSQHKGVNGFTIITIEDPWPCYAHRDGKGLVNVNMYDLKVWFDLKPFCLA